MDLSTITAWLLAALTRHMSAHLDQEAIAAREEAINDAMAVAFEPPESPVNIPGLPATRAETALALLVIELHETGLRARFRRGECHKGECDGGCATGEFQLHLTRPLPDGCTISGGIRALDHQAREFERCESGEPGCVTPPVAIVDHFEAARVALHMLRAGGLPGYTGQPWDGPAPRWIRGVMASAGAPPKDPELLPKE